MIKQLSVQYQIQQSCQALGVSRSGYYQWVKGLQSQRKQQESELLGGIETVFAQNQKRYGSPRVTQVLRAAGRRVGKNRVARLMRQRGLVARKKRAFRPKTTVAGRGAEPNRIAGLSPEGPDQIWASDITYVATKEGWLYLAVVLDLFSRRVVGWKLDESMEADLVSTALHNALVLRQPGAGLVFHSDRGCQYMSQQVCKALEVIGAQRSMSGLGNCYDNAKCEAFFSSLKTECFPENTCFESKQQATRVIFEYIELFYNNQRLHSRLGYQPPQAYEAVHREEKKTTFSPEKVTVTVSVEGGAKVKPANGINGRGPRPGAGRTPFMPDCDLTVAQPSTCNPPAN